MVRNRHTYKLKTVVAVVVMAMSLLWLTVSLPFVYYVQVQQETCTKSDPGTNNYPDTEEANPFANATEEKAPSSVNLSEEYIHHCQEQCHICNDTLTLTHKHSCPIYVAFHGELLSPPPEM